MNKETKELNNKSKLFTQLLNELNDKKNQFDDNYKGMLNSLTNVLCQINEIDDTFIENFNYGIYASYGYRLNFEKDVPNMYKVHKLKNASVLQNINICGSHINQSVLNKENEIYFDLEIYEAIFNNAKVTKIKDNEFKRISTLYGLNSNYKLIRLTEINNVKLQTYIFKSSDKSIYIHEFKFTIPKSEKDKAELITYNNLRITKENIEEIKEAISEVLNQE